MNLLLGQMFKHRVNVWVIWLDTRSGLSIAELKSAFSHEHLYVARASFVADPFTVYAHDAVKHPELLVTVLGFPESAFYLEVKLRREA